jgi:hypothetical protein
MLTLVSCTSVKENIVKNPIPQNIETEIRLVEKGDSILFSILLNEKFSADNSELFLSKINSISITAEYSEKNIQFYSKLDGSNIKKAGIALKEFESSSVLYSFASYSKKGIFLNNLISLEIDLNTAEGIYHLRKSKVELFKASEKILKLIPLVLAKDERKIDFGILAYRYNITDEYIPNSEIFRLEVRNMKGKPIYNSQEGGNFMQVIYPVYPENIGEFFLYSYSWNLKDNDGEDIVDGDYSINMMIPALPKPYRTELFYDRK